MNRLQKMCNQYYVIKVKLKGKEKREKKDEKKERKKESERERERVKRSRIFNKYLAKVCMGQLFNKLFTRVWVLCT